MPGKIKQIEDFRAFKRKLKLLLMAHSFYTLQELLDMHN
jgi:hypothetical protein